MMKKLGFIGTGNMGSAIINGVVKAGLVSPADISAADINRHQTNRLQEISKIHIAESNRETAQRSDVVFLCVKPTMYDTVIAEIKEHIKPDAIIVSIAAGLSMDGVCAKFRPRDNIKIARAMPNIAAQVNSGMTAVCAADTVSKTEIEWLLAIFNSFGKAELLPEHLFAAFTALAGSSPAYAFMFIEALADAGVKHGLSRAQALRFSTQALLGAAKMLQDTNEHPALLKDAVCTPGGTTIEAVCELEKQGFKNTVIASVNVCVRRSLEIGGLENRLGKLLPEGEKS
jgi:pyrroline-5-carboxylate reductase